MKPLRHNKLSVFDIKADRLPLGVVCQLIMVRLKGLEPARVAAREPKSRMSTNSITGAYFIKENVYVYPYYTPSHLVL